MAISKPKSSKSIGMIGSQYDKMVQARMAAFQAEEAKHADDKQKMYAALSVGLSGAQMVKQYRDAYLSDIRTSSVFTDNSGNKIPMFQKDMSERTSLIGKTLGKAKDFVWERDLVVNPELKEYFKDESRITPKNVNLLLSKGYTKNQVEEVMDKAVFGDKTKKKKAPANPNPYTRPIESVSDDDSEGDFLMAGSPIQDLDFATIPEFDNTGPELPPTDAERASEAQLIQRDAGLGDTIFIKDRIPTKPALQISDDPDDFDTIMRLSMHRDKKKYVKSGRGSIEDAKPIPRFKEPIPEPINLDAYGTNIQDDIDMDAAIMQTTNMKKSNDFFSDILKSNLMKQVPLNVPSMKKGGKVEKGSIKDLNMVVKELEKASKMHLGQSKRIDKHLKSMQDGGLLKGPSHKDGGILTQVGDQPIEMEGGEYVIKKSSVNKLGKKALDYINKTGKIPKKQNGGQVEDDNNDPNFMQKTTQLTDKGLNVTGTAMTAMSDYETLQREGGAEAVGAGLGLASTALDVTGIDSLSGLTGGMSSAIKGLNRLDEGNMDAIDTAKTGASVAGGAAKVGMAVGEKVGSKLLEEGGKKVASTVAKKVTPGLAVASGVKDLTSSDSTNYQKAAAGMDIAAEGLSVGAAANAYNPAGWVMGAAATALKVGSVLTNVVGASNTPTKRKVTPTIKF
jgi:hypothetical protein